MSVNTTSEIDATSVNPDEIISLTLYAPNRPDGMEPLFHEDIHADAVVHPDVSSLLWGSLSKKSLVSLKDAVVAAKAWWPKRSFTSAVGHRPRMLLSLLRDLGFDVEARNNHAGYVDLRRLAFHVLPHARLRFGTTPQVLHGVLFGPYKTLSLTGSPFFSKNEVVIMREVHRGLVRILKDTEMASDDLCVEISKKPIQYIRMPGKNYFDMVTPICGRPISSLTKEECLYIMSNTDDKDLVYTLKKKLKDMGVKT